MTLRIARKYTIPQIYHNRMHSKLYTKCIKIHTFTEIQSKGDVTDCTKMHPSANVPQHHTQNASKCTLPRKYGKRVTLRIARKYIITQMYRNWMHSQTYTKCIKMHTTTEVQYKGDISMKKYNNRVTLNIAWKCTFPEIYRNRVQPQSYAKCFTMHVFTEVR